MKRRSVFAVAAVLVLGAVGGAQDRKAPVELGHIRWLRNFDKAVEAAKESDKPILVLFQEVPGWGHARGMGRRSCATR
jgi:hypothetical protein